MKPDPRSREVVEILSDVVKEASKGCVVTVPAVGGGLAEVKCPDIHYVFGNASYIKENLDELSKSPATSRLKFPLIALFCPFQERRDSPDYRSKAKVRVLIACSSSRNWSNEQRLDLSFCNVLRPIYDGFIAALRDDGRFDFGPDGYVRHDYTENYTYGRYGAYTDTGEEVSEPIDAIVVSNLELKVKNPNCK